MVGLKIPKATSTTVTIDKKISTPQIFCVLDANVKRPRKIDNLCSTAMIIPNKRM
jgi:hypothetical protein